MAAVCSASGFSAASAAALPMASTPHRARTLSTNVTSCAARERRAVGTAGVAASPCAPAAGFPDCCAAPTALDAEPGYLPTPEAGSSLHASVRRARDHKGPWNTSKSHPPAPRAHVVDHAAGAAATAAVAAAAKTPVAAAAATAAAATAIVAPVAPPAVVTAAPSSPAPCPSVALLAATCPPLTRHPAPPTYFMQLIISSTIASNCALVMVLLTREKKTRNSSCEMRLSDPGLKSEKMLDSSSAPSVWPPYRFTYSCMERYEMRPAMEVLNPPKGAAARKKSAHPSAGAAGAEPLHLERALGSGACSAGVVALQHPHIPHLVAYTCGATVVLWDSAKKQQTAFLTPKPARSGASSGKPYACLAFSRDGAHLAAGERGGTNPEVLVWEVSSSRCLQALRGHKYGIGSVSFSQDGRLIYSTGESYDGLLCVWDWQAGGLLAKQHTKEEVSGLCLTEEGGATTITTVGKAGHFKV
ncbi:WD repeat domain-containing protein [Tetrabaena socialis]|uniref:WD repeat domain-containing protein n=1 Tax=Tetrabaena socialis TaxID=47790 RepID=A0A2J8AK86_9CHLO|nr:WD repeat domain-containing protein [Tetrabaena socialis]|eukprot:PNH12934.1 WD repeat domain-containing protein [Tetrabaena socialis]